MFLFVSVPVCQYSSVTIFDCVYIPLCPCTSEACVCSAMSMLLCVFVPLCLGSSVSMSHCLCSIMSLFHPLHSTVSMFCRLFSSCVLVSYRAYVPPSLSPPSALFVNVCDLSRPVIQGIITVRTVFSRAYVHVFLLVTIFQVHVPLCLCSSLSLFQCVYIPLCLYSTVSMYQ